MSEASIDNAVRNILRLKFRLGLFEHPYVTTDQSVKYAPEHLAKAKEAAGQSAILLKNTDGVLPFGKNVHTLAVIGLWQTHLTTSWYLGVRWRKVAHTNSSDSIA